MKRLRIFAGPNGSGKTTLKNVLEKEYLGVYVNADDIEKELKEKELKFDNFHLKVNENELKILNEKGLI